MKCARCGKARSVMEVKLALADFHLCKGCVGKAILVPRKNFDDLCEYIKWYKETTADIKEWWWYKRMAVSRVYEMLDGIYLHSEVEWFLDNDDFEMVLIN